MSPSPVSTTEPARPQSVTMLAPTPAIQAAAPLDAQAATPIAPPITGEVGPVGVQAVGAPVIAAGSTVLTVGVGKQFATVAAAINASQDGNTILVDAGTYTNDFADVYHKVTLIGVGGMVNMVATVPPPNLKGLLTIDNSVTIQNFSFSGVAIDDVSGGNGAGIRYQGGDMVLKNDLFQNNQNGILAFPVDGLASNTITLDHDTFNQNGSGSGFTHNAYIGAVDWLSATNNVFEQANVGHELKSRALVNTINNNLFYDGPTATASYSIDLPNGGKDTVTNNTIEKGPNAENNAMIHFSGEGIPYSGSSLLVQGNAFVDDKGTAQGVLNQSAISVTITGNTFKNMGAGAIVQGPAVETNNYDGSGNKFADGTLVGVLPGSTQIFTDTAPHTVSLDGSNGLQAVEGGAGLLTVSASLGHIVVIGGTGGMNFTELGTSGGNSITTAAASTNSITVIGSDSIDSEGTDTIVTGSQNDTGVINGTATLNDGTGSNYWTIGGATAIHANNSNEFISLGSTGNLTLNGLERFLLLNSNGGTVSFNITQGGVPEVGSLVGGSLSITFDNGVMNVKTGGGAQGANMTFTTGNVNVTSVGSDYVQAGSGADSVIVSGAASVHAGTGQLSVFGRGDTAGAKVYGASGDTIIAGDTGNITYYGGATANTVESELSNDVFVGGAGRMTINGGSRETVTGGAGGVNFNANGGGANTIATIAGSTNVLHFADADTVASAGADTITTNGSLTGWVSGASTITAGAGNVSLTLDGRETFIGTGHDELGVAAGAVATITNSGSADTWVEGGTVHYTDLPDKAKATVTGTGVTIHSDTSGKGISVTTSAGQPPGGGATILLTTGPASVNSQGADKIHAGSGTNTIVATTGAEIWGGSGAATVQDYDWAAGANIKIHGGSGSLNYDQGSASMTFIGGSGSAMLNGEYGAMTVTGGSGAITATGKYSTLHFTAGSGTANLYLTASGGSVTFGAGHTSVATAGYGAADIYTFAKGHGGGTDVIEGFRQGTDHLMLSGVSVKSQSVSAGNSNIVLSDNTHLKLTGVTNTAHLFG